MSKVPKSLPVKITVSDISVEVPKAFFENAAMKAAVFVGRKGKGSTSRHTKYFTVANPEGLPTCMRPVVTLGGPVGGDASGNDTKAVAQDTETEMVVLKFGDLNNVTYDLDIKPLSKYDGQWVFDEVGNPFVVFVRITQLNRKGVAAGGAKSELESNTQEMMQMDDQNTEESPSNNEFSGSEEQAASDSEEELDEADLAENTNLTAAQIAAMNVDDRDENEVMVEKLISEQGGDFKRRYLEFPKMIDVSDIVNTKAKRTTFSERVKCKNATLIGTVVNFTVTATLPEDQVTEYEEKQKLKEAKEERKRREEEEKILAKERKKAEKDSAKRHKKDAKDDQYGVDIYAEQGGAPGGTSTEGAAKQQPVAVSADGGDKKKKGFAPLQAVKGIFTKEQKQQNTPFPLKCVSTPYPFLFILDRFTLRKLQLPHELYRAVHIRLGCDPVSLDEFPLLLLDATKASALKKEELPGYGEGPITRYSFDFGTSHIYFGDKHIRNVCGFDTLRALQEFEKVHHNAGEESGASDTASGSRSRATSEVFQQELLNVGEKFTPVRFEPLKKVANDCMAKPTKYTRVSATLIVPSTIRGETPKTEDQVRRAFVAKIAADQKQREREAKKAEKAARKATKQDPGAEGDPVSSDDENPDDWTCSSPDSDDDKKEEEAPAPASDESGAAAGAGFESHGEAAVAEGPAYTATPQSRITKSKSRSFQLSTRLLNEEYTPREGMHYAIRFATGEEIAFRARKVYLPAVASMGPNSSIYDTSLPAFKPNA